MTSIVPNLVAELDELRRRVQALDLRVQLADRSVTLPKLAVDTPLSSLPPDAAAGDAIVYTPQPGVEWILVARGPVSGKMRWSVLAGVPVLASGGATSFSNSPVALTVGFPIAAPGDWIITFGAGIQLHTAVLCDASLRLEDGTNTVRATATATASVGWDSRSVSHTVALTFAANADPLHMSAVASVSATWGVARSWISGIARHLDGPL